MLEARDISFRYSAEKRFLFQHLNFRLKESELIFVKGASGSGKTTLLYILCSVIPKMISGDLVGEILFKNSSLKNLSLPEIAPKISLMMQEPDHQLFFPSVEQELAFGPENLKLSREKIRKIVDETVNILDLESILFQPTHTLSFGQKKIVAFASLVTLSPQIFLLDEPSAGLSDSLVQKVEDQIIKLLAQKHSLIITDHQDRFEKLATKIIDLDA